MTANASTIRAAFWMAGWLSLMLVMPVAGREAARDMNLIQVMEMRSIIGFLMIYPLVHREGGLAAMRTSRIWMHVARNSVHYLAQYGWLLAVTLISLAQVVSIEFTMPIWTAILAVTLLGERMTVWKVVAVVLGLIGVIVIVRPGASDANAGQLIALATAVGFGMSVTMVKSLTRTESVVSILFWMVVIQSAIGLLPAIAVWRWPSAIGWTWVLIIAFCGTFSHYCMTRALRYADATVVVPMDFLRVPLSAVVGWLVYTEAIDLFTALGATLILAGNLLNLKSPRLPDRKPEIAG
jgi:drug/metabolite transporter (DMT)-like permease